MHSGTYSAAAFFHGSASAIGLLCRNGLVKSMPNEELTTCLKC